MVDTSKYEADTQLTDSQDILACVSCNSNEIFSFYRNCLHCICDNCLKEDAKIKLCCPVCQEKSDHIIRNTILMRKEKNISTIVCSWCRDNGEKTISVGNCRDCVIDLCAECINGHNRMPPFRNHSIEMTQLSAQSENLLCELHPKETLELYCEKCNVLTCRNCQLSEHREHGGHSWVSEKAISLKPKLKQAVEALTIENSGLDFSLDKMTKSTQDNGDLRKSANKATDQINIKCEKMKKAIEKYSQKLIDEINSRVKEYMEKISRAEDVAKKLQSQIEFITNLSYNLLQNVEKDPASLVQLSESLLARIENLLNRAMDISSDKNKMKNSDYSGWSDVLSTRVYYLENRETDEVLALSGMISWSKESNCRKVIPKDTASVEPDSTLKSDFRDNEAFHRTLDAINEIEKSDCSKKNSCRVCFGSGVMAVCAECKNSFHSTCHLPRIISLADLDNTWSCSLCCENSHDEKNDSEAQITPKEFKTGCTILLKLITQPDFGYLFHVNCPSCGISTSTLLSHQNNLKNDSNCKAYHIYHKLYAIRGKLEYFDPNQTFNQPNQLPASFAEWLKELFEYFDGVINGKEEKYLTMGTKRAASNLKAYLTEVVNTF